MMKKMVKTKKKQILREVSRRNNVVLTFQLIVSHQDEEIVFLLKPSDNLYGLFQGTRVVQRGLALHGSESG